LLVAGVNGVGKTTSIAKLANLLQRQGLKVVLGAGDTFRAAAVEQLTLWSQRLGCTIVRKENNADPAAVAYDACETAKHRNSRSLLGETARNLGNILIGTTDWKHWMIDCTRAFRLHPAPKSTEGLSQIDRSLLARLRLLDAAQVREATSHCINGYEVDALMKRRDAIVAHYEQLIAQKGAAAVLYGVEPAP